MEKNTANFDDKKTIESRDTLLADLSLEELKQKVNKTRFAWFASFFFGCVAFI